MPSLCQGWIMREGKENTFIHYTETLDEISLLVDTETYGILRSTMPISVDVDISPYEFRAISVSEGEVESMTSFDVTTGLVSALSTILAEASISIFYVSTYQTDYVCTRKDQVEFATQVLKEKFGEDNICVEDEANLNGGGDSNDGEYGEPGESNSSRAGSNSSNATGVPPDPNAELYLGPGRTLASVKPSVTPTHAASVPTNRPSPATPPLSSLVLTPLQLHALPQTLHLVHFTQTELSALLKDVIRLFFFPLQPHSSSQPSDANSSSSVLSPSDRFFSYSHIGFSVSMQVDSSSLALLRSSPSFLAHLHNASAAIETWRCIQVAGDFGFDECGIVAALSAPLTAAKICPFYLSTYSTDYLLVQETKWSSAEELLARLFKFVPRQRKVRKAVAAGPPPASTIPLTSTLSVAPSTAGSISPRPSYASSIVPPVCARQPVDASPYAPLNPADTMGGFGSNVLSTNPSYESINALQAEGVNFFNLSRADSSTTNNRACDPHAPSQHHQQPHHSPQPHYYPLHSQAQVGVGNEIPSHLQHRIAENPYAPMSASDIGAPVMQLQVTNSFMPQQQPPPSNPYAVLDSADMMTQQQQSQQQQVQPLRSTAGSSLSPRPSSQPPSSYSILSSASLILPGSSLAVPKPQGQHAPNSIPSSPLSGRSPQLSPRVPPSSSPPSNGYVQLSPRIAAASAPIAASSIIPATSPSDASFESLFTPVSMGTVASSSAGDGPSFTPFTDSPSTFGHCAIEKLQCFMREPTREHVAHVLGTSDASHTPMQAAQAANPSYASSNAINQSLTSPSSPSKGDGRFLFRTCQDAAELLEGGHINENLFVLCHNKNGALRKSKIYRLPGQGLSLGLTGHRIFPNIYAIVAALVGVHARPIA